MSSPKPQTEIAFIPLKPGVDVSSGEHKQVLLGALGVIRRQEGCKAVYWGVPIEREGEVEVIIGMISPSFPSFPFTTSNLQLQQPAEHRGLINVMYRVARYIARPHLRILPFLLLHARIPKHHHFRRSVHYSQR